MTDKEKSKQRVLLALDEMYVALVRMELLVRGISSNYNFFDSDDGELGLENYLDILSDKLLESSLLLSLSMNCVGEDVLQQTFLGSSYETVE